MANELGVEIEKAVRQATANWNESKRSEWKASRVRDRKSRSKSIKKRRDSGWVEEYPLKVEHAVTHSGRNCHVSVDGCETQFAVVQHHHRPLFTYDGTLRRGNGYKPMWQLQVTSGGPVTIIEEQSENFESLVQRAIVSMVGHAYMEIPE